MKNNGLPVTVVWPSAVLFSTLCRTTSGLISTDAPQSSTPAFSEEGTRTHTAPVYDRRMWERRRRKWLNIWSRKKNCAFTFLGVNFGTAAISYVDIDASAVRRNLQETIWTICKSNNNKKRLRMLLAATDGYHTWLVVQSETACSPITVSPDMFFTVAFPFNQQKHRVRFNQYN